MKAYTRKSRRACYANGCHYVAARPFFHYTDSLSECSEAGDQEADAQPFDHLGSRWANGRIVKADSLWEQLRDLQHKGSHLHISLRPIATAAQLKAFTRGPPRTAISR